MLQITPVIDHDKLEGVIVALETFGVRKLPNTSKAVHQSTEMVQQRWIDNASGAFHRPTGAYLLGIQEGLNYPYQNDEYRGAVINTAPHARFVEEGTKMHDMKKMLWTSDKVRISKKGKRYLIIPFRHGTPSAGSHEGGKGTQRATLQTMPKSIHEMAKNLSISRQTGASLRTNPATGRPVIRHTYQWGGRLKAQDLSAAGLSGLNKKTNWKSSPYANMVKMGGEGQTTYMTFRIMHEDSKGWIHPGTPPRKIAEKTWNEMKPVVQIVIGDAAEKDFRMLMGAMA